MDFMLIRNKQHHNQKKRVTERRSLTRTASDSRRLTMMADTSVCANKVLLLMDSKSNLNRDIKPRSFALS